MFLLFEVYLTRVSIRRRERSVSERVKCTSNWFDWHQWIREGKRK